MTEGVPQFRLVYKGTTVKAIAPLTVRIELPEANKENMLSLFSLPVMPESFWKNHKLSDPLYPAAGRRAVSHYRLANGPVCDLFPCERLLGSHAAGKPGPLELRYNPLRLLRMITWPSRHLRQAHLIYVSRTAPKTGRPAISEKFRERLYR